MNPIAHAAENILDGFLLAGGIQAFPDGVRHTHIHAGGHDQVVQVGLALELLGSLVHHLDIAVGGFLIEIEVFIGCVINDQYGAQGFGFGVLIQLWDRSVTVVILGLGLTAVSRRRSAGIAGGRSATGGGHIARGVSGAVAVIRRHGGIGNVIPLLHIAHHLGGLDAVQAGDACLQLQKLLPEGEGVGKPGVDPLEERPVAQGGQGGGGELGQIPLFQIRIGGAQGNDEGDEGEEVEEDHEKGHRALVGALGTASQLLPAVGGGGAEQIDRFFSILMHHNISL